MRRIAFINQKGGVGKTTTAVNVAAGLGRLGQRVLLIDLDPQGHASLHVGVEVTDGEPTIYDVLMGQADAGDSIRYVAENLGVLPASIDLVAAELELATQADRERALQRGLASVIDGFDTLVIDCPPSLGLLTLNALAAVREVIIPLQPHFFALQGLGKLLETVTAVRGALNPQLRVSGVLLCMYDRGTKLAQEVSQDVATFLAAASPDDAWHGAALFDSPVRRNIKLAECPSFGQTIFDYAPDSNGAEDYAALAGQIAALDGEAGDYDGSQLLAEASADAIDIADLDAPPINESAPLDAQRAERSAQRASQH